MTGADNGGQEAKRNKAITEKASVGQLSDPSTFEIYFHKQKCHKKLLRLHDPSVNVCVPSFEPLRN